MLNSCLFPLFMGTQFSEKIHTWEIVKTEMETEYGEILSFFRTIFDKCS